MADWFRRALRNCLCRPFFEACPVAAPITVIAVVAVVAALVWGGVRVPAAYVIGASEATTTTAAAAR